MSESNHEDEMKDLFVNTLKAALEPSGITVSTPHIEFAIPPDADMIICRRDDESLSDVTREILAADGLKDYSEPHVAILFYHDEVVDVTQALRTAVAYSYIHSENNSLEDDVFHSFLVITSIFDTDTLKTVNMEQRDVPGVYNCDTVCFTDLTVIVVDELADKPCNAILKSLST